MNRLFALTFSLFLIMACSSQNNANASNENNPLAKPAAPQPPNWENPVNEEPRKEEGELLLPESKLYLKMPEVDNPEQRRIHLRFGRYAELDCNDYFINGELKPGFRDGREVYTLQTSGIMAGTLMECLDGKTSMKFVPAAEITLSYKNGEEYWFEVPDGYVAIYQEMMIEEEESMIQKRAVPSEMMPLQGQGKLLSVNMPKREREDDLKVQLLPGKITQLDCNEAFGNGQIEIKTIQGKVYRSISSVDIATTKKLCSDDVRREEFVHTEGQLLPYSSDQREYYLLVANDMTAKYRFWKVGKERQLKELN